MDDLKSGPDGPKFASEASAWRTAASLGVRAERRAWTAAVASTAGALVFGALELVRHATSMGLAAGCAAGVAGACWTMIVWRRRGPWNALDRAHREWLLAQTQAEAFAAAANAYALAAQSAGHADPRRAVDRAARRLGVTLTDAQIAKLAEALQTRARVVPAASAEVSELESNERQLFIVRAEHAAAKARLVQLEAEYKVREDNLRAVMAFERAELEREIELARQRLRALNEQANAAVDTLRYPEARQAPTSDVGVSAEALQRAVDEGMMSAAPRRRVAVQPGLIGAALSDPARWAPHAIQNVALTRELLELFEPGAPDEARERADEEPGPTKR